MIEFLKRRDRILLEMHTGILAMGLVCQAAGVFFAENQARYAKSLWFGILFALVSSIHMARTLDRALLDSSNTQKIITRGYAFRYIFVVLIIGTVAMTDVMNPLVVFMAYMSLKVTAYLQPLTHKFYNKLFHETDPVPEALPEERLGEEGAAP